MDVLAIASDVGRVAAQATAEGGAALFQVNLFWVIVSALNFIVFFALIWTFAFKPVSRMLDDRRERIEQGLKDAEQARRDRENAEAERVATLAEARKEANDILARAQRLAQETRDADIAATREELDRMRERATNEIEAEKQRAIGELRGERLGVRVEVEKDVAVPLVCGHAVQRVVLAVEVRHLVHVRRADQPAVEVVGPRMIRALDAARKDTLDFGAQLRAAMPAYVVERVHR